MDLAGNYEEVEAAADDHHEDVENAEQVSCLYSMYAAKLSLCCFPTCYTIGTERTGCYLYTSEKFANNGQSAVWKVCFVLHFLTPPLLIFLAL